ncbi:MAG: putative Histidine kinase, partial [Armatimonadetes bacterium]|nr:putative Histidine kinase [Armatimonadota bacterium]
MSTLRVLILDNSEDNAHLVLTALRQGGFEPQWKRVQGAIELEEALLEQRWDIVLSDYAIPGFDGMEALRLVRETDPELPFILVSGVVSEEAAVDAMRAGAKDYVLKSHLSRVAPVVTREVAEAEERRARRRAEEALLESERHFRALIENAQDITAVLDARGIVQYESPSLERVLGYKPQELVGTSGFDIIHPEDAPRIARIFAEGAGAHGAIRRADYRCRHKDGTWRVMESIASNLLNVPPVNGIVINSRDITDRVLAEQQAELQAAALSAAADGILISDREGNVVWVNPAFTRMTGYPLEEVVGQKPRRLKSGQQDDEFYKQLWDTIRAGSVWTGEVINRRKDGALYPEEMTITPVRGGDGEIRHFVAIKRDITERKRADTQLRAAEMKCRQLLEQLPAAIYSTESTPPYRVTYVSPDIVPLLGYSQEDWLNRPGLRISAIHPEDRDAVLVALNAAAANDTCLAVEYRMLHRDGHVVWVRDNARYLRDASGALTELQGVVFDITERQRLEEALRSQNSQITLLNTQLQDANDQLRQAQQSMMREERLRALGQMASGIAHDINNSLAPIVGFAELILMTETGLSEQVRSHLNDIRTAGGDIAQIVKRMREFYRKRDQSEPVGAISLQALIPKLADLTRARWKDIPQEHGTQIELRLEVAPDLPPLLGNESEIREVLTNLVFNAVDAMPQGGVLTLRAQRAEGSGTREGTIVEVADTGVGMDEETRSRCLEPFFTTKGARGTGLGLAMVFGTMQRHNGQVEIESACSKGTVVRLVFPQAGNGGQTVAVPAPEALDPLDPLRVLYVDDDPRLRRLMRNMIS